jgi:hypothetical protein
MIDPIAASVTNVLFRQSRVINLHSSADSGPNMLDPIQFLLAMSLRIGSVNATSVDELISTTLGSGDTGLVVWKDPQWYLHPLFENDYLLKPTKRAMHDQVQTTLAQAAKRVGMDGYSTRPETTQDIFGPQAAKEPKTNRKRSLLLDAVVPKPSKVHKVTSGVNPPDSLPSAQLMHPKNSTGIASIPGSVDTITVMNETLEQLTDQDWLEMNLDFSIMDAEGVPYPSLHSVPVVANNPSFAMDEDDLFSQGLSNDDFGLLCPELSLSTEPVLTGVSNSLVPQLPSTFTEVTSPFIPTHGSFHHSQIDPSLGTPANATSFYSPTAASLPLSTSNRGSEEVIDTSTSSHESVAKAAILEKMALPRLEFITYLSKVNVTDVPISGKPMRVEKDKNMNGGSREPLTNFVYQCWVTPGCAWQSTIKIFKEHHELECSKNPWRAPSSQLDHACEICDYVPKLGAKDPEMGLYNHVQGNHLWVPKKCSKAGCNEDTLFLTAGSWKNHLVKHRKLEMKGNEKKNEKESKEDAPEG